MKKPNRVMDLLGAYCLIWQQKFTGARYFPTGRDRAAVRDLLALSPDLTEGEVVGRARAYLMDEYWAPARYPAHGLFEHFNRYIGQARTPFVKHHDLLIHCGWCDHNHRPGDPCVVLGEEREAK